MPYSLVGVVGPNGCGKSNIIDAVRWVLGETRASALRGESMQDVIFNGTSTRKPVSRASVELVFDNDDGKATGQWSRYAEIAVRRVLERTGESSYFINNARVRRRDVVDLFLGTGLGPKAYAIIEQGMISRIIEARPEEIRSFLEEAAGVTRYRERRRETEGRLADARDNLARLDDIRMELGERISHLEVQASAAEQYQMLSTSLIQRQQLFWLIKKNAARAALSRASEELNSVTSRIDVDNTRLQDLGKALETARSEHLEASEVMHAAQSDLFAASAQVSRLEAELQHLVETRQRVVARLEQIGTEAEHWRARQTALVGERERWEALSENAVLRVVTAQARYEELSDHLPELESIHSDADRTVHSIRRELAATEQQLRVEEANRVHSDRALSAFVERRTRLTAEHGGINAPEASAVEAAQARLDTLIEQDEALQQELASLQASQPELQATLKAAIEFERSVERQLTELRAERNALVQLQTTVGKEGDLGEWLASHGHDALEPLWKSLDVDAGWEAALGAVLRERLAARVIEDDSIVLVADLLGEPPTAALVAGFGSEPLGVPALPVAAPAGATPLIDRVRAHEPVRQALLADWLNGWFSVDKIEEWLLRRKDLAPGVCLVSARGQVLSRGMLANFAPDAATHGVIERQREIDLLGARQETLEEEALRAHDAEQAAESAASGVQTRLETLRQQGQTVRAERHAAEVEALKLTQAASRASEQHARIDAQLPEFSRQHAGEPERNARAEAERARAVELAELQRNQLEEAVSVLRQREDALNEARALEHAQARELQEAEFSERECCGKLDDIKHNVVLAVEQIDKIALERSTRQAEFEACDDQLCRASLEAALEERSAREAVLAERRDALEAAAAHLRQTEELRLTTEHQVAPLRVQVTDLRLEVQSAELAVAQFDERLTEAGADEAALARHLERAPSETSLQRDVARLTREITALGAVNLAAVEELRTASERKQYLDLHNDDLVEAIGTLEDAIRRIDRETREQLQATYNTVNKHFGKLFPMLFGGGRGELVLTGEEILDAGIQIVAQPPGKKNATIHLLSGGEKALTAIALVFAMFQLNPAPFCMLDEVDAPLDDANTGRYAEMVKRMSSETQFIFISHNKITMEAAQQLIGVTMQEQGVSRIVEVDMEAALRLAEPAAAA